MIRVIFLVTILSYQPISKASLTEPITKWSKNNLSVCFGGPREWGKSRVWDKYGLRFSETPRNDEAIEFTQDEKNLIISAVNSNFTHKNTGLHFTGWSDCRDNGTYDIYIFRIHNEKFSGQATIGFKSESVFDRSFSHYIRNPSILRKEYVLLNTDISSHNIKISRHEFLAQTALHEFGHVAGLRHEEARFDHAKIDPNCMKTGDLAYPEAFQYMIEKEGSSSKSFSVYDPNSIMSGCFLNTLRRFTGLSFSYPQNEVSPINLQDKSLFETQVIGNNFQAKIKISLSSLDKHSLKCLYVYDEKEFKDNCHEEFTKPIVSLPVNIFYESEK
jgi:hypothetical protein